MSNENIASPTSTSPPLADDSDLMSGYTPGTPIIDPGSYPMKITKTEVAQKDGRPNPAHTIKMTLSNVETVRDIQGNILQPGEAFVFTTANTVVTGKSSPKMIKDGVAYILQSARVSGLTSVKSFQENHKLLEGAIVLVKLDTAPARTGTDGRHYDARTEVIKWWPLGTNPQ